MKEKIIKEINEVCNIHRTGREIHDEPFNIICSLLNNLDNKYIKPLEDRIKELEIEKEQMRDLLNKHGLKWIDMYE